MKHPFVPRCVPSPRSGLVIVLFSTRTSVDVLVTVTGGSGIGLGGSWFDFHVNVSFVSSMMPVVSVDSTKLLRIITCCTPASISIRGLFMYCPATCVARLFSMTTQLTPDPGFDPELSGPSGPTSTCPSCSVLFAQYIHCPSFTRSVSIDDPPGRFVTSLP